MSMLSSLSQIELEPIIDQVLHMGYFKRYELNHQVGKFFNDAWQINNDIQDTPLGRVLASLGPIGQSRLLRLESGETYTAHTDPDDRIHLAIVTNPHSYLIDIANNNLYHIEANGQLWHMDTSRLHTASNWGSTMRIHLNVRVLLPHYNNLAPGVYFHVNSDKTEWKGESYIELMGYINKQIKSGYITGFDAPDSRTLYLNTLIPQAFTDIVQRIRANSIDIEFKVL